VSFGLSLAIVPSLVFSIGDDVYIKRSWYKCIAMG
jgi:hypothetical protein